MKKLKPTSLSESSESDIDEFIKTKEKEIKVLKKLLDEIKKRSTRSQK